MKLLKWRIMTPAKITALVNERVENARLLHMEDCNRPLRHYSVKIKGTDTPIQVNAHGYSQELNTDWLCFNIKDPEANNRVAHAFRLADVEWFKSEDYGEVRD